jgi:hypothetical protein
MLIRDRIAYMSESGGGSGAAVAPEARSSRDVLPGFAATLPQDIRAEAAFRDIKDVGGLAKSYLAASRMIGGRPDELLKVPTDPNDEAGWNAAYTRLGRPETADKYTFAAPTLPEGLTVDPALRSDFAAAAHKAGLNTNQVAMLYDWYNREAATQFTAAGATRAATEATATAGLKTEWGLAFDQNVGLAKQAVAHYGDPSLTAYLEESHFGNDPRLLRVFARLGAQLSADGLIGGARQGGGAVLSPAEAQRQITALRADAAFSAAYMDTRHPGHADAVRKMAGLHDFAYPAAA